MYALENTHINVSSGIFTEYTHCVASARPHWAAPDGPPFDSTHFPITTKRDSLMEDAERMAQQLIAEEEESKAKAASKKTNKNRNKTMKSKKYNTMYEVSIFLLYLYLPAL